MKRCSLAVWLSIVIAIGATGQTTPGAQEGTPAPGQSPPQQTPQAPQSPATVTTTQPAGAPQSPAAQETPSPEPQAAEPNYNKIIFQNPIPSDQLAFLKRFDGVAAGDLLRDKQFHKFMRSVIPDCMFHYGRDRSLLEAMEMVLERSPQPAQIRDGRYLIVSGRSGPYLQGRGFLWIDLQDGIVLGGFYFHPTNGEPTPAVNIFSRQVKEEFLAMSELPPAFAEDLSRWLADYGVPAITTRYFITGSNKKILLEHDEDYCLAPPGTNTPPDPNCQQMNAAAADIDMDAANYVEQTHHATNATAWMITGEDQRVWIRFRTSTCRDLLPCRIRLTRARVRVIIRRPPAVHRAHR